jgi:hypothetical protein
MVLTESILSVKDNLPNSKQGCVFGNSNMPSFNDDKGTALLLNAQGEVVDELAYNEKWHFKLMDHYDGVALERIDYNTAHANARQLAFCCNIRWLWNTHL